MDPLCYFRLCLRYTIKYEDQLQYAVDFGSVDLVETLIRSGHDVNRIDEITGLTALEVLMRKIYYQFWMYTFNNTYKANRACLLKLLENGAIVPPSMNEKLDQFVTKYQDVINTKRCFQIRDLLQRQYTPDSEKYIFDDEDEERDPDNLFNDGLDDNEDYDLWSSLFEEETVA